MNATYSLLIIIVVSICTILLRAFPFLIFGGKKELPQTVQYLGKVLPPAIMAVLVVYCLRSVSFLEGNHGIPELISVALVAGLHLWKKNILLSIGLGTVCYMVLIQLVF
ncbi:MAG: branched-chain amino acid transporter permease [Lachnospiraceae bacterium]|nr:branched-chain amino acid transporter permease [Lachnospiraceae bacterium]